MQWNLAGDRRHEQRVPTRGSAMIHLRGGALRARIADLAVGGARLYAEPGADLRALERRHVRVALRLDGVAGRWRRVAGRVVRVEGAAGVIVARFDDVPPDFEDLLQDELLALLESHGATPVLLVDLEAQRRQRVGDALRAAGCRVVEARTPLEAIYRLETTLHLAHVVIAAPAGGHGADELCRFVREVYPALPLATVGHAAVPAARLDADDAAALARQVARLIAIGR